MPGMGYFLQNYFMLFLFSALLGQLMSSAGCARKIALSMAHLLEYAKSDKERRFLCLLFVPILYFILCYIGISGFVVVFTVLPIAKELYEKTDTPWRLYCVAGSQSISQGVLVGSLSACNIYAADVCGTSTTAGVGLSLVLVGTYMAVSLALIRITVYRLETTGEGFLPSGAQIKTSVDLDALPEENLPRLSFSLFPVAVLIVLSAGLHVNVVVTLAVGCLITLIIGYKNIFPDFRNIISKGISASFGPILCVSATYAIGNSLKQLEGFRLFEQSLTALPPLLEGVSIGVLTSFIMASAAAPVASFGEQMLERYTAAGLSVSEAHRMMTLTSFSSIAPHNAGISNAAQVLRLPYSSCIKVYMIYTYIPGFAALLVGIICIHFGII